MKKVKRSSNRVSVILLLAAMVSVLLLFYFERWCRETSESPATIIDSYIGNSGVPEISQPSETAATFAPTATNIIRRQSKSAEAIDPMNWGKTVVGPDYSLAQQIAVAEYQFTAAEAAGDRGPGWFAPNRAHRFASRFDSNGLALTSLDRALSWSFSMGHPKRAEFGSLNANESGVKYRGEFMDAWYINGPAGLEQGFTLHKRPEGLSPGQTIELILPFSTELDARLGRCGQSVSFFDDTQQVCLRYESLFTFDAAGERVPGQIELDPDGQTITLAINDTGAQYPLFIDPVFVTLIETLVAVPPGISPFNSVNPEFGKILAIDNDVLAVGDPIASEIHIFERNPLGLDQWEHAVRLKEAGTESLDALQMDNGTLTVFGSNGLTLFERNLGGAGNWGPAVTLTDPQVSGFGLSHQLDDNRMAIGSLDNFIFIFERNSTASGDWSEAARINGDGIASAGSFGTFFKLKGSTLVAAYAPLAGFQQRVSVFNRDHGGLGGWGLVAELALPENPHDSFGSDIAISDDESTVAIRSVDTSNGDRVSTLHVYLRDEGGTDSWGMVNSVVVDESIGDPSLSFSLDENGRSLFVGVPSVNLVYIFEKDTGGSDNWGEVTMLSHPFPDTANAEFGYLAYDRGVLMVGDPGERYGAVYPYRRGQRDGTWAALARPVPANQDAGERMGRSVAMHGDFLVVGAPQAVNGMGEKSGTAYVFIRDETYVDRWQLLRRLNPAAITNESRFGHCVAIDGDWIVVGAPGQVVDGLDDAGSVFVYQRDLGGEDNWGLRGSRNGTIPVAGARYGSALAIDDGRIFVGSPGNNNGGRVHILTRNTGSANQWGEEQVIANPGDSGDLFGSSLSADESRLLVGAPGAEGVATSGGQSLSNAGRAYLYSNALQTGGYLISQSLPVPGLNGAFGNENARYGEAVSLQDDMALIGAPGESAFAGGGIGAGAAYIHAVNESGSDQWGEQARVQPLFTQSESEFGASVWLDLDRAYVGAPGWNANGTDAGAVLIFDRNRGGQSAWGQSDVVMPLDGVDGDLFGKAVLANGPYLFVGLPGRDANTGAVELQRRWGAVWRQEASHVASGSSTNDLFGAAVAIDGDTLVVGAADLIDRFGNTGSIDVAGAYVFKKNRSGEDAWGEVRKLLPTNSGADTGFGHSVDISGNQIIVGAYLEGSTEDEAGAAYVFRQNEGGLNQWSQLVKLEAPVPEVDGWFGYDVALDEGWAAISAIGVDDVVERLSLSSNHVGRVFVYRQHLGAVNPWLMVAQVDPPVPSYSLYFGSSIALDSEQLLVGAGRHPAAGDISNPGGGRGAFIFERNQGGPDNWGLVRDLLGGDTSSLIYGDDFGREVALHGDYAAVTGGESLLGTDGNKVYLFDRNRTNFLGEAWGRVQTIRGGDDSEGFGHSLSLDGDYLAIGSAGAPGFSTNVFSGAVYLYARTSLGQPSVDFGLQRIFRNGTVTDGGRFGSCVAVSARTLVVGSDKRGLDVPRGEIFVYTLQQDDFERWAREQFGNTVVDNEADEGDVWGPYANPDGDDFPNLVEAYLDLDPESIDNVKLINRVYADHDSGEVAMRWFRAPDFHDIIADVLWSVDLQSWYGTWDSPEGITPPSFDIGVVGSQAGRDLIEVRAGNMQEGPLFFQLRFRKQ